MNNQNGLEQIVACVTVGYWKEGQAHTTIINDVWSTPVSMG